MMERDSLRKERLDHLHTDIQYGIESGTAAAWNAYSGKPRTQNPLNFEH